MDLKKRIEELNAEKERIEKELAECVKQSNSFLGVPVTDTRLDEFYFVNAQGQATVDWDVESVEDDNLWDNLNYFHSEESAKRHSDMMKTFRLSIANNSKNKAYPIDVLLPLLRTGWVAMNADGIWFWYDMKPHIVESRSEWYVDKVEIYKINLCFPIEKASNWKMSLRECGIR